MTNNKIDIGVIGGGAAGFFAAINAKIKYPKKTVVIFERSKKVLSKVKISGGGRCNVTNATDGISDLSKNYPRGFKELKKVFAQFKVKDTVEWFESRGVELVTQEDKCIFPVSQNSQTIIDCFLKECKRLDISIQLNTSILKIQKIKARFSLISKDSTVEVDHVILTIGGQPKKTGFSILEDLDHSIIEPVPSLFTFNMPNESVTDLMGIVVNPVTTKIQGTKLVENGPLLITHWGMSGPAILKLSAWGARILEEKTYSCQLQVNWLNNLNYNKVKALLDKGIIEFGQKKVTNQKIVPLPKRLWDFLLGKINLNTDKKWSELSKKELNKLCEILVNDVYSVQGKTTFKEEFVTAGGVNLNEVDFNTMQSKLHPGLFFAGEVLDVDGITGGFNFQAAWSTAFVASHLDFITQ
ncbi:MAG: NAD(P)/FAD-dependent oxidoreductase [Crocinitomicaceae bacterium]